MIFPRLRLLECVELRAGPRGRPAFLRKLGMTERRFNELVSGRADPTPAEKRALLEAIPENEYELFGRGPADSTTVHRMYEQAVR